MAVLAQTIVARDALQKPLPVFLKIAPDLSDGDITDIAEAALETNVDAVIATNTTLDRDGLRSPLATEAGGLSGAPLFDRATAVLARLARETNRRIPLIGVGGIHSAEDAYTKIRNGASAVQFYTAMVYEGLSLAHRMARDLDALLERDGTTLAQATGADL